MNTPNNPNEFRQKYNVSQFLVEVFENENRIQTIVEDIKTDRNIHIDITRFIYDTDFYKNLNFSLQNCRNELAKLEDNIKRIEKRKDIAKIEEEIKEYKVNILKTASTLYKIKNTDKIDITKHYFFKGEIKKAYESIQAQDLFNTQKILLDILQTQEKLEEVYEKLVDNSNEYLIKAELTALNIDIRNTEDRFQKAIEFFEEGAESVERSRKETYILEYYFKYAVKTYEWQRFEKAVLLYEKLNQLYSQYNNDDYKEKYSRILNNLAISHLKLGNTEDVEQILQKALIQRKELAYKYPLSQGANYIISLCNEISLHFEKLDYVTAKKYAYKAYREMFTLFKGTFPLLSFTDCVENEANILSHLGNIYFKMGDNRFAEKCYLKAICSYDKFNELYDKLNRFYGDNKLQNNPQQTFIDKYYFNIIKGSRTTEDNLSAICNNLGLLYKDSGKYTYSSFFFHKAKYILEYLFSSEPLIYGLDLAETYSNMGILYSKLLDFEQGSHYFEMALNILEENKSIYHEKILLVKKNIEMSKKQRESMIEKCGIVKKIVYDPDLFSEIDLEKDVIIFSTERIRAIKIKEKDFEESFLDYFQKNSYALLFFTKYVGAWKMMPSNEEKDTLYIRRNIFTEIF